MPSYRLAGQEFHFRSSLPELTPFRIIASERQSTRFPIQSPEVLVARTVGLVGGIQRAVEVWSASPGTILKVEGGSKVYISPSGHAVLQRDKTRKMTGLDREILAGPALVLALAQRGVWCLHAGAVLHRDRLTVFLGESGQGKSTLAAYLSAAESEWRLVADDMLPVAIQSVGLEARPHFPQLKIPVRSQPGIALSERIPLSRICILANADDARPPELQLLPHGQAVQSLIGHTAGARLFDADLLAAHLAFCSEAAARTPVYRLVYPRRMDALAEVREILKS